MAASVDAAVGLLQAAEGVAKARVALAESFIRFKIAKKDTTDGQAMQQAIVETQSALDVALAQQEIARHRLNG